MSRTVCEWLKRATMREPSGRRSCSEVVGLPSSTPSHSPAGSGSCAAAELVDAPAPAEPPPSVRPVPVKYLRAAAGVGPGGEYAFK